MPAIIRKSWNPWRVAWILLASALVFVVACVGWLYWLFNGGIFRTSGFDEAAWKSMSRKTSDSSCYRGGMAHDITTNVLRVGLPRAEVERLLGVPDYKRANTYAYFLGMCSGLRMDFDTLDVYFDPEGGVMKTSVVQH